MKNLNTSEYCIEVMSLSIVDDDFFNANLEPEKSDENINKSQIVTARFTQADYKELLSRSKRANMSISKYIKTSALNPDKEIVVYEGLKEFNYGISKIGNNLNQLATLAHQGKVTSVDLNEAKLFLKEIWLALDELSKQKKQKRR